MNDINTAATVSVESPIQKTVIVECELCDTPQVIFSDRSDGVLICRSCREEIARDDFGDRH